MEEKEKATGFENFQVFERETYDKSLGGTIFASIFMSAIGGGIVGFLAATYYVWIPMLIGGHRSRVSSFFNELAMNDHSFGLRFAIGMVAGFIISMIGIICIYRKYMSK